MAAKDTDKAAEKDAETDDKTAATESSATPTVAVAEDKKGKKAGGALSMRVRISSPFKVFFDDDAVSLSGKNATGPFDILPHHHNFISLLPDCELAIKSLTGNVVRVRISGGIMHVKADQVIVFLNV